MGKVNWGRVLLCGIVAGTVYTILGVFLSYFALQETGFGQANLAGYRRAPWNILSNFILNLIAGVWTIWLYASIRPRYGPGLKTAVMAGVAAWLLIVVIVVQLASVQVIPLPLRALVIPAAAFLLVWVVASTVGAWQYKE
jgi:hypothetical protein